MKHSKQRDAILTELCGRVDHPTAEELYFSLKKTIPTLSLGTVYRNLSQLSEEGVILKLTCGGADHFDGNPHLHYHLLCTVCNRLFDMEMPVLTQLDEDARRVFPGRIDSHRVTFYGVCPSCTSS